MASAALDLDRRRPVWTALAGLFLDRELDEAAIRDIAEALRQSHYSPEELEHVLWAEVCPVLYRNLGVVAGAWAGFDMDDVERQILAQPAGVFRRWWAARQARGVIGENWRQVTAYLGRA